ncbi:hypothetical protein GCM10022198_11680 [Klugiella xanthotipulae]|uniref:Uncharacterized protein n=1 Tax=Klugiella xanthotipulae TaxID=244735 RepID=A0A543I4W1_9MICO|nr:DUF6188 family protein [Klugiella xanthotipulae]TQM65591.1 hypothetical protein FB466_0396 [Klugiella xanthotipulae]
MADLDTIQNSLQGVLINKIELDFRITLVFEEFGSLALSCPFEITLTDETVKIVDPEGSKSELAPALEVVNTTIKDISISSEGVVLRTSNGMKIRTYSDPQFESWVLNLDGPEGVLIIGLPDGEIGIWGPNAT